MRSFPQRHSDATGKPETRDETRGCKKKRAFRGIHPPILIFSTCYQTGWNVTKCHACHAWQPAWTHSNRTCFPASPIDTATPQENQRLETRHVDAEKPTFRTRLPPNVTFSTHYQTGWNVTKCHACHAKRHDNLLGHIRIGEVFQLPP